MGIERALLVADINAMGSRSSSVDGCASLDPPVLARLGRYRWSFAVMVSTRGDTTLDCRTELFGLGRGRCRLM